MTNLELIAKLAGVSRGTVDRVLHNRGQVRPETEEKVQAVMQELDFQPNALGRAFYLSRKKNKIGILVAFREPDFQKQVKEFTENGGTLVLTFRDFVKDEKKKTEIEKAILRYCNQ